MHSKKYPNFNGKRLQKSYSKFPYVSWLKNFNAVLCYILCCYICLLHYFSVMQFTIMVIIVFVCMTVYLLVFTSAYRTTLMYHVAFYSFLCINLVIILCLR